jgi:DNA repair exonuclease SbcCD nuclease subunit
VKIAIIGDTHFGARNDSPIFMEHFMRFFDRVFFPYVETHGITEIIHLGDFLDRRKFVNIQTLNAVRSGFVDRLEKSGAKMNVILGNHDIFYKNRSDVNSLRELFDDKFVVHDKPTVLNFDGTSIAMLPWINAENEAESLEFIKTTSAEILCAHLELNGFNVLRTTVFQGGMNPALFSKFKAVYTGHFHTKHTKENIHYLGCPYQITMSDYGDKKGFHVLDTDTGELEFIQNPYNIFLQIRYNDEHISETAPLVIPEDKVKGQFVRILVENKTKPYLFEKFVDAIYGASPHGVTIIEDFSLETVDDDDDIDLGEDTLSVINKEIDGLQNINNIDKLKALVRDLYAECLANETLTL